MLAGLCFSGTTLEKNLFSCLFHLLRATLIPWFMAPFLHINEECEFQEISCLLRMWWSVGMWITNLLPACVAHFLQGKFSFETMTDPEISFEVQVPRWSHQVRTRKEFFSLTTKKKKKKRQNTTNIGKPPPNTGNNLKLWCITEEVMVSLHLFRDHWIDVFYLACIIFF